MRASVLDDVAGEVNATEENVGSVFIDKTDSPALWVMAVAQKRFDPRAVFEQKRNETTKRLSRPILKKPPRHNVNRTRVAATKNRDDGERKDVCACSVIHKHKTNFHAF